MSDIDDLFDELNVTSNPTNTEFEVDGYKFWISTRGIMRKKVGASRFIVAYNSDDIGVMTGKYDKVIDYMMTGVSVTVGSEAVDLSGDKFYTWLGTLPEENEKGEQVQSAMRETLPLAVAAVIVGKLDLSKTMQRITTLSEHTEQLESLNTSSEAIAKAASQERSKKPVRKSRKVVKVSG